MSEEKSENTTEATEAKSDATSTPGNNTTDSNSVTVDFGGWINKGFTMYKENAVALIVAGLIAGLLIGVTFGILAGPMIAGLTLMTIRIYDGEKVEIGDVFQGFQFFLPSFLFILVWGFIILLAALLLEMIPILGILAGNIPGLVFGTLLIFAMPMIVDKKMDFWAASMASIDKVKPLFWPLLGLYVVGQLIGSAGLILCFIGVILTMPISYCIFTAAYRNFFPKQGGESKPADA